MVVDLSSEELQRYARHLTLPQVGVEGQIRLKRSSVLLIGAGGLGCPAATYLAASGVGRIGIVEADVVERSNLQRQTLFTDDDVGRSKLDVASDRLKAMNPDVEVVAFRTRFTAQNAMEIAGGGFDVIVDGTDNFATRYLSNDVAHFLGIPNVYGSIFRFEGQCSVFAPSSGGPCYRCMFPKPPEPGLVPSCAEGGVLGVLPGIVGSLQAMEAVKLLLGVGKPLVGRLVHFDALAMRFREFTLPKDPECPLCGENPSIHELVDYEDFCGLRVQSSAIPKPEAWELSPKEVSACLREDPKTWLLDVREPFEYAMGRIAEAVNIPLGELPERSEEVPTDRRVVVYCKAGMRSERALRVLREHGNRTAVHLAGGIDAWREGIDPSLPEY